MLLCIPYEIMDAPRNHHLSRLSPWSFWCFPRWTFLLPLISSVLGGDRNRGGEFRRLVGLSIAGGCARTSTKEKYNIFIAREMFMYQERVYSKGVLEKVIHSCTKDVHGEVISTVMKYSCSRDVHDRGIIYGTLLFKGYSCLMNTSNNIHALWKVTMFNGYMCIFVNSHTTCFE